MNEIEEKEQNLTSNLEKLRDDKERLYVEYSNKIQKWIIKRKQN